MAKDTIKTSDEETTTEGTIKVSKENAEKSSADIIVNVEKISPNATIPVAKTKHAACFDLAASEPVMVKPNAVTVVHTGLKFEMPENVEAQIRSRSGLASQGIFVMNSPGTVDADYRGEVMVLLYNTSASKGFQIEAGDRIAQVAFREVPTTELVKVKKITSKTERGDGAMGSTGIK